MLPINQTNKDSFQLNKACLGDKGWEIFSASLCDPHALRKKWHQSPHKEHIKMWNLIAFLRHIWEQKVDIATLVLTTAKIWMALACNLFSVLSFIEGYIHPNCQLTDILNQWKRNNFFLLLTKSSEKNRSYSASIHVEIILLLHICKETRAMRSPRTTTTKMVMTWGTQQAHYTELQQSECNWRYTGNLTAKHLECTAIWFVDSSAFPSYVCMPGSLQEFWLFRYCRITEFPGQSRLEKKLHVVYC